MDCRLGGGVISDRASFSDALVHPTDATLPHIVFTLASECHGACLVWNSLGSTPPAMDTRSRAPPTRTFTVINVIICVLMASTTHIQALKGPLTLSEASEEYLFRFQFCNTFVFVAKIR